MNGAPAKRLSIIGNGPLPPDVSGRIDASDAVIRFNNPVHPTNEAGSRTDILFVVNSGKTMQVRLQEPGFLTSPYFVTARQIILPYDPEIIHKYHPKPNPLSKLKGRRADWTEPAKVMFERAGKNVTVLPASFYEDCCEELEIAERERSRLFPSTGFIGIRYGIQTFPPPEWVVEVFGFSFEGWKRHAWEAESRWVARALTDGAIHNG
jgi:hypothetical protein